MLEILKDVLISLIFAGVCAIGAWLLRTRKQQIISILADLIQQAERAVQGTGLGAEKKAMVIAQLEAMGIKVTAWMSTQIDNIVAQLNERSAWFVSEAGSAITAAATAEQ